MNSRDFNVLVTRKYQGDMLAILVDAFKRHEENFRNNPSVVNAAVVKLDRQIWYAYQKRFGLVK